MIASIITALYLSGAIDPYSAYTFLYVCGILLIAGEIAVGGHGLLILNALFAFFVGYAIQTGDNQLFGVHIDWSVLFGLASVEAIILGASTYIYLRYRKIKASTGKESMIGQKATIVKWDGTSGIALVEGENWKVKSTRDLSLTKDSEVTIAAVEGLTLIITN